jgi:DsbC/DsbD-like thiol-disulfide interchange protein
MTTVLNGLRLSATGCAAVLAFGVAVVTAFADASPWRGDDRSAVRLLAGSRLAGRSSGLRGGVEIRLKSGWHTYWRYPGDSGVPPVFDFSGSRNLKEARVLWPAPQRIAEAGSASIGYVGGVIFPLRIVPQDGTKPVALRLKLDYAICEKLCVPVESVAALVLPSDRASQDSALAVAESRVPKKVPLAAGTSVSVRSVRREDGPGRPRVVVDVAAPADAAVSLFAEGPTPKWALPVPVAVAGAPVGLWRFAFELDGAPPGERYEGQIVTLTAVTRLEAIEVTTRLD